MTKQNRKLANNTHISIFFEAIQSPATTLLLLFSQCYCYQSAAGCSYTQRMRLERDEIVPWPVGVWSFNRLLLSWMRGGEGGAALLPAG